MDDLQMKRVRILVKVDKLTLERCNQCNADVIHSRPCCKANVEIQELGMELLKLTKNGNKPLDKRSPLYRRELRKWRDVALRNGIKETTFYGRVNKGVPFEKAATTPKGSHLQMERKKQRTLTEEQKQIARENGLKLNTVYHRLSTGWSEHEAVSTPPDKRFLSKRVKATN